MLLNLLEHHQELFHAAVWPLILRRDCRSLGALGASCRQIREFLAHKVPFWKHFKQLNRCLHAIECINTLSNGKSIIREYNNTLYITTYRGIGRFDPGYGSNFEYHIWNSKRQYVRYIVESRTIKIFTNHIKCKIFIEIIGNYIPEWLLKYDDGYFNINERCFDCAPDMIFKVE